MTVVKERDSEEKEKGGEAKESYLNHKLTILLDLTLRL